MTKYKITFDRNKCIGALNCVGAAPDFWKLANDGKVDLVNSKKKGNSFELIVDEKDYKNNLTASKVCPAQAVKVEKI
ncbi:MAG: ferredoxin [Candidatus Aenigmatarchaeota archaeon]